ncbi:MAG: LPXTG cell wall anchor domain-containing protein [Eubacterium sp.]|nr:LPXTG cell wall anchor domain-containing protein [Eubacterium sp.]
MEGAIPNNGTGKAVTIGEKDYAAWIIPLIPAGKKASLSFKVTVDSDAKESDLIENVALVKPYGDDLPEDPWIPEEYVPTNRIIHPLNPWTETTHTVDVEKEDPETKDPGTKDPEKSTTEQKTKKSSPRSGDTGPDEGTSGPKGGVQTGVHSNELLYAAVAAVLALAAILVRRRRKKRKR